jgi:hypothetical protein
MLEPAGFVGYHHVPSCVKRSAGFEQTNTAGSVQPSDLTLVMGPQKRVLSEKLDPRLPADISK